MSKLRLSAVTIPEMRSTFFVVNLEMESFPASVDRSDWTIDHDVQLIVPEDLYLWPDGAEAPGLATLCRSLNDPKHYEVLKRPSDVREDQFRRTDMAYGGLYPESHWKWFVKELPQRLEFYRGLDMEPPAVQEAALTGLRRGH